MTEEDKNRFLFDQYEGMKHPVPFDKLLTQVSLMGALNVSIYLVGAGLPDSVKESKEWKRLVELFGYLWEAHGLAAIEKSIEATPEPFNPPF